MLSFGSLKIIAVVVAVGFLIHSGMRIERAKAEAARIAAERAKNAEIAKVNQEWSAKLAQAEAEGAQAVADAIAVSAGLEACKLTEDQIKKANRVR